MKRRFITIPATEDFLERLRWLAFQTRMSRPEIVRRAVGEFTKRFIKKHGRGSATPGGVTP